MIPAFPTRRRADEFDRLVEAAFTGADAASTAPADLRDLAVMATSLTQMPAPEPRAAFAADLRERLMTAAATELKPAPDTAVRDRLTVRGLSGPDGKQRRLTVAVATVAVVAGTAGTALASQNALPGDTLYPVKRAIENIQTSISQGDQSKGETLIADAHTRLSEVGGLAARRQPTSAPEIASTLAAFAQQAQHASSLLTADYQAHHDAASITALHQFTRQSISELTQLSADLPPSVHSALTQATQTLLSIDQAAKQLCPSCGAPGITQLPSSLLTAASPVLHQLAGVLPGTTGTTRGDGTTDAAKGSSQLGIKLPQLPGVLPPATVPSAIPGTGTTPVTGAGSAPSAKSSSAPSRKRRSGTSSQSTSSKSPSSSPTSVGDTVTKVTNGVGDLVGGVVKGLLGGG